MKPAGGLRFQRLRRIAKPLAFYLLFLLGGAGLLLYVLLWIFVPSE